MNMISDHIKELSEKYRSENDMKFHQGLKSMESV